MRWRTWGSPAPTRSSNEDFPPNRASSIDGRMAGMGQEALFRSPESNGGSGRKRTAWVVRFS
jgi:hypothetical protein